MTLATVRCRRVLDLHLLVTCDALTMIGPHETGTPVLQPPESFSMTGGAFGRLKRSRTVVMTPHTQGRLLIVEMTRHLMVCCPRFKCPEDLAMGELCPFILVCHDFDDQFFRYLIILKLHENAG